MHASAGAGAERVGTNPASADRASLASGPVSLAMLGLAPGDFSLLVSGGHLWYVMVTSVLLPVLFDLAVIVPRAPWKVPVPPVTLPRLTRPRDSCSTP